MEGQSKKEKDTFFMLTHIIVNTNLPTYPLHYCQGLLHITEMIWP